MTHINRKFFDELALVLREWRSTDGIIDSFDDFYNDIAEVLHNNCMTFQSERFLQACMPDAQPYHLEDQLRKSVELAVNETLKLGSEMKVIPLHPDPEWSGTRVDEDEEGK